jgi:thymidylate synthase ThyX
MNNPKREVISVWGVEPEVGGYGMAKFSRSHKPYQETVTNITQAQASEFYKTFYLQYKHKSIADLAHGIFIFQNISNYPAREALWDDSLLDGQESSTRYLNFTEKGVHIPDEVKGTKFEKCFKDQAQKMIQENADFQKLLRKPAEQLIRQDIKNKNASPGKLETLINNKVFDIARQVLPVGHYTNMGLVMSGRTAERLMDELLIHPIKEVRDIAQDFIKAVTKTPSFIPTKSIHEKLIALPTVGSFIKPNDYRKKVLEEIEKWARKNVTIKKIDCFPEKKVILARGHNLELETLSSFLYRVTPYSYRHILRFVEGLPLAKRKELFKIIYGLRGEDDELLREMSSGNRLIFDITSDLGSHKDLHRHRRCIKIAKPFNSLYGYVTPSYIKDAGLEERYVKSMNETGVLVKEMENTNNASLSHAGAMLLGYGWRRRYLMKMDATELQYITELRTKPEGHFYYREIAWLMFQEFKKQFPSQAQYIRAWNPYNS